MHVSKKLLAVSCFVLTAFFGCSNNPVSLSTEKGDNLVAAVSSHKLNCGGSAASPFVADQYFSGGTARTVTNTIATTGITNPAPQAVYKSERYGATTYTLPNLTAGVKYKVRLHFAELYQTAAGKRKFNVSINGTAVLSNFDIYATAGAQYKAVLREFTATANSSGQIKIVFSNVTDNASICGIEILSPLVLTITPGTKTICAGPAVTISALASGGTPPYLINFDNGMWSNTVNPISYNYLTAGLPNGSMYTYYCWVTDANGTKTTAPLCSLAIRNATITTDLPATKTVAKGGTVTFSIVASGINLTYQWWRSGRGSYAISGATSSRYTITNADPIGSAGDNPIYRCIVTDGCGNTVSSSGCQLIVTQ